MNKIIIATDSTADLSKETLEARNIASLPLYVNFKDQTYQDGITITPDELFKKVLDTNVLPKTTAPSPGDFYEFFKPYVDAGYEVIYMGIGSKFSATIQSAKIASLEFNNKVTIIDSLNLSSGIGILILKACDFRDSGLGVEEITKKIEKLIPLVRCQFVIAVLEYMHKGGRISTLSNLFGSVLKIKPVIKVKNGKMEVYKKIFGKKSKGINLMLDDFFKELDNNNLDLDYLMITHSFASQEADLIKKSILNRIQPQNLLMCDAGCIISSHCGKGTIGIVYILKNGQ